MAFARTFVLGLLLATGGSAQAQMERLTDALEEAPFTLTADEVAYDEPRELFEATGNVRIEQVGGRVLTADWLAFNATTRSGVATGNVRVEDGGDVLTAQFAAVDLDTLTAIATDAELVAAETGFVVRGETLRKTGADTYEVEDGNFTTCRCTPPDEPRPWEIEAGEADVQVEGNAVLRDLVVRVLGWPIFYSPWMIVPLKTKRQSGFLFPTYKDGGRNGPEVAVPFFWAVREDLNVLITPTWIQRRGIKAALAYEYVFGEQGYSDGGLAVLPSDDEVDRDDPDTAYSDDRWAYWLRHEQPLGPGLRFGTDIQRASDNDYVVDFDDLTPELRQKRFMQSSAWLSSGGRGLYGSVVGRAFDDLQSPNDLDRDDYELHRLPQVTLASASRPFAKLGLPALPLRAGMDARYTHFWQNANTSEIDGNAAVGEQFFDTGIDGQFNNKEPNSAGVFDDQDNSLDDGITQFNGVFNAGELLADRGHRVDLYPRVSLPLQAGIFEGVGEIGLRETLYSSDNLGSTSRTLWTGLLDARTRFGREFRLRSREVHHVVEPHAGFAWVSNENQSHNAFFVPNGTPETGTPTQKRVRSADPRLRLTNPSDRVAEERYIDFGIRNRFFTGASESGAPPHQLAMVHLFSGYDLELSRIDDLFLELELDPLPRLDIDGSIGWDTKEGDLDEALGRVRFRHDRGHSAALEYRYLRNLPQTFEAYAFDSDVYGDFERGFDRINQLSLSGRYVLTDRYAVFGSGYLPFNATTSKSGTLGLEIRSMCDCWALFVSVTQRSRPSDTIVQVALEIEGFGYGTGQAGP